MGDTNEKSKDEGTQATQTTGNTNAGNQYEVPQSIRLANEANQRLEQNIKELDIRLNKLAEFSAQRILGGTSYAGQKTQDVTELSPKDYAKAVMSGQIKPKNPERN